MLKETIDPGDGPWWWPVISKLVGSFMEVAAHKTNVTTAVDKAWAFSEKQQANLHLAIAR